MHARWPMVAFCLVGILTLRTDGRGGFNGGGGGGWGGGRIGDGPIVGGGGGSTGGGTGSTGANNPHNTPTLENAMGEAVWTGGSTGDATNATTDPVYKPLTKDQTAKAVDDLRTAAKAINDKFHMHFKDASTAHTLVYSTAGADVVPGLADRAEQAYSTAARVFSSQSKQIVLPGKVLVYILDKSSLYESFAKDNDNFTVPKGAIGYTWLPDDSAAGAGNGADASGAAAATPGVLHIVMGPPPDDLIDRNVKPITAWQAAMVRAMAFALIDRFHSSRVVPTWAMQGLADVAADSVLPQPVNRTRAYLYSQKKDSNVVDVLNDKSTDFSDHPEMQTLTETLLVRDRAGYVKFILAIKDGKTPADALQANYKWSFDQLGDAWNTYVKHFSSST